MIYEEPMMEIVFLEGDVITLTSIQDPDNGSDWGGMVG